jgi:hypothetical protein
MPAQLSLDEGVAGILISHFGILRFPALLEMYLRKMREMTACLYSAAFMLLRSMSAASQSLASKPRLADAALGFAGMKKSEI